MRIGDFDKLKQTIKDKYSYASATGFLLTMKNVLPQDVVYQILTLIDEAPSVDTTEQEENAYNEGYVCGSRENTRPQGEWIDTDSEWLDYKCDKCGWRSTRKHNFCPNCGAKMQKGGAE